ncbi:CsbD family protein [Adhaeribacter radiodurans]|uniref:CsbD family protein n=1 Tax=Adhaeribacter radiodurans TaxID=2745197 RepID=A0A7L7L8D6_9BACT|nr:CsbD family protein [Adhaeribacter radiodurans]QMU28994.1 CsbD family protein [Adhaeribacter radiodurans]
MAYNDFDNDATELRARSNWTETKGKIRQEYGHLTDDDLEYAEGTQEEWLGKIGDKIGKAAQDVKNWISRL